MMEALEQLKEEYGTYFAKVFQTIIADNGSEFGRLSELTGDSVKTCFRTPLDKLFQFSVCKRNLSMKWRSSIIRSSGIFPGLRP